MDATSTNLLDPYPAPTRALSSLMEKVSSGSLTVEEFLDQLERLLPPPAQLSEPLEGLSERERLRLALLQL